MAERFWENLSIILAERNISLDWVNQKNVCRRVSLSKWIESFVSKNTPLQDGTTNASKSMGRKDCAGIRFRLWRFISEVTMKRIIPVYIFQQVNVLLVSLYLLKLLCIGELTILLILLWSVTHFFFLDVWQTKTSGQGQYEN